MESVLSSLEDYHNLIFICENPEAQKKQTTVEAGVGVIRKDSWQMLT